VSQDQYPSPYSPPPFSPGAGGAPYGPNPLALARRAAILLFVLGALGMLLGLCIGPMVWVVPMDQVLAQSGMRQPENLPQGVSMEQIMRITYTVVAVILFITGAVLAFLGIFVRRGNRGAMITAAVIAGLAILWFMLNVAGSALFALGGNPSALMGAVVGLVPLSLFGLLMSWLLKALKQLPQVDRARQQDAYYAQQQAQYWQSQQQQYQQQYQPPQGAGYGYPPAQYGQGQTPPPSGYGTQPPANPGQQPSPDMGSVRHPPLPPGPQDPNGPPQG
jgi:hypothetical protein